MDQNWNINLQVVQGDFHIKYGPKTLKHPWSISLKTIGHFEITFLKYNGKSIFFNFSNTDQNVPIFLKNSNYIALY